MAEQKAMSDKEKAQRALNQRPETFRWTINGITFTRDGLIKEVNAELENGAVIILLARNLGDPKDSVVSSQLGKRHRCLVCGTEALTVKAGAGRMSCCEQNMELQEPRTIESSD